MNRTYRTAKIIVRALMIAALAVSYTHVVHLFNDLGLHGWQAWIAPAFIDGFAMLGLLGRSEQFADSTRRTGFRLQVAATLVSLVANVASGDTVGAQVFGALVVVGYVVAEWYADQLKPAATAAEQAAAKRSAAASKAAATRKANAASKGKARPAAARGTRARALKIA